MRKNAAQRGLSGKGSDTGNPQLEEGICVLCGGRKTGVPAQKDFAIRFARWLRRTLGTGEAHSIACKSCLAACARKRDAFESEMRLGRIFAVLFFIVFLAGGVYFGGFGMWTFVPAIIGSIIILLLPYGKYFPKFQGSH